MSRTATLSASAELNLARLASLAERIATARKRLTKNEPNTEPAAAPASATASHKPALPESR